MMIKKLLFFNFIFGILLISQVYGFNIKKDAPVPNIVFPNLQSNQQIDIQTLSQNRPYLVSFLYLNSSWGNHLISYYKQLLIKTNGKMDVYVIALDKNLDLNRSKEMIHPNLYIGADLTQQYAKLFQVIILPTTFFINHDHLLQNIYIDMDSKTKQTLLKDIEKELNMIFTER